MLNTTDWPTRASSLRGILNPRRVTVRDVASAAGVSQATASRVLGGNTSVDRSMARRVIAASEALGYSPNVMARALRTQKTGTVGIVVPALSNPYFIGVVEALENVLASSGRSIILCHANESPQTEAERIRLLLDRIVDGLVVVPVSSTDSTPALTAASQHCPVVQFDRFAHQSETDFVGIDNPDGIRQIVEHMQSQGATNMAFIGARPTSTSASERLAAFRALVRREHRWRPQKPNELIGDFSTEWGYEAADRIVASRQIPDAILCGADIIAFGVLARLRESTVRVPEHVLLASYDDSAIGALTSPLLTSIHQPLEAMAHEAVRLLDERSSERGRAPQRSIFPPKLVVRESSIPVR